jgi:hypothetical protein
MEATYTPVQWVHRELIAEAIDTKKRGKIFFFSPEEKVSDAEGAIRSLEELPGKGMFIQLDTQEQIRIDRIITLFGKPGAAFDEYDAYANACMDCTGGYDIDELR